MLTGSLSSSSSDNKSLKQQFIDAIEKFERIGTSSDNVGGGGDELVVEFRECAERVRLLSLYSSNESLQEMGNERLR